MGNICETVKVKNGDGFMLINKSDYDESKHDLFSEKKERKTRRVNANESRQEQEHQV